METTKDISMGQVVKSKAGRDEGRVFLVVNIIDDKYVLVADGDIRRLDSPKRKKVKHLIVYKTIIEDFRNKVLSGEKVNNAYIRKVLQPFNKEI